MTPELKAQWVEALRSGKYKQGAGFLRSTCDGEDTFCCLGVLAAVLPSDLGTWYKNFERHRSAPYDVYGFGTPLNNNGGYLIQEVREAAGLSKDDVAILVRMNDNSTAGFNGIADYIETHL